MCHFVTWSWEGPKCPNGHLELVSIYIERLHDAICVLIYLSIYLGLPVYHLYPVKTRWQPQCSQCCDTHFNIQYIHFLKEPQEAITAEVRLVGTIMNLKTRINCYGRTSTFSRLWRLWVRSQSGTRSFRALIRRRPTNGLWSVWRHSPSSPTSLSPSSSTSQYVPEYAVKV